MKVLLPGAGDGAGGSPQARPNAHRTSRTSADLQRTDTGPAPGCWKLDQSRTLTQRNKPEPNGSGHGSESSHDGPLSEPQPEPGGGSCGSAGLFI